MIRESINRTLSLLNFPQELYVPSIICIKFIYILFVFSHITSETIKKYDMVQHKQYKTIRNIAGGILIIFIQILVESD